MSMLVGFRNSGDLAQSVTSKSSGTENMLVGTNAAGGCTSGGSGAVAWVTRAALPGGVAAAGWARPGNEIKNRHQAVKRTAAVKGFERILRHRKRRQPR